MSFTKEKKKEPVYKDKGDGTKALGYTLEIFSPIFMKKTKQNRKRSMGGKDHTGLYSESLWPSICWSNGYRYSSASGLKKVSSQCNFKVGYQDHCHQFCFLMIPINPMILCCLIVKYSPINQNIKQPNIIGSSLCLR